MPEVQTGATMREMIDAYYKFREYEDPSRLQALLFLISELGELTEAYREIYGNIDPVTVEERTVIQMVELAGRLADKAVSGQKDWVRNNDRAKAVDLGAEAADVFMMLDRFALAAQLEDPETCLREKMAKKGFKFWDISSYRFGG